MRIFLIGFMGCGKTSVGKKLAHKLNLQNLDLDQIIESQSGKTISQIFEAEGEEAFRKLERDVLHLLLEKDNYVLSCGGGTPIFFDNLESMKASGKTVYLEMNPAALYSRLKNETHKRPLLKEKNEEQIKEFISENLNNRKKYYEQADIIIPALNIDYQELIKHFR